MSEVTIEDVITNCEDIDLETNADNLRAVYKVMTEKDSEYYIPPKAWKQLLEYIAKDSESLSKQRFRKYRIRRYSAIWQQENQIKGQE